jgi:hypothetical protein
MSLQNAAPAVISFARYFARPICPQCGDEQFVPERSEFAGDGVVRHAWLCENCSLVFCTAVAFDRRAA